MRISLQLQEFGSKYEAEALRSAKKMEADVIVYVYDSSDTNSFSYISNLRVSLTNFDELLPNLNLFFDYLSNNTILIISRQSLLQQNLIWTSRNRYEDQAFAINPILLHLSAMKFNPTSTAAG